MKNNNEESSLREVFMSVGRLHFLRSHALLEKRGLYPGQPQLLLSLYKEDGQSQRELGEHLKVKASTITVMINRLEKAGFVKRMQDAKDQRVTRIYLTQEGLSISKELEDVHSKLEEEAFKNLTVEERLLLRRLLMQVRDNLKDACDKEKNLSMDFCHHIKEEGEDKC